MLHAFLNFQCYEDATMVPFYKDQSPSALTYSFACLGSTIRLFSVHIIKLKSVIVDKMYLQRIYMLCRLFCTAIYSDHWLLLSLIDYLLICWTPLWFATAMVLMGHLIDMMIEEQ